MTWEEAERLMTFIREQQAQINAKLTRMNERFNRPPAKIVHPIDCTADDRTADRAITLLATVKHAREVRKFDERLNVLLKVVERHISEG